MAFTRAELRDALGADGLNRRLGNGKAYCLVNGQRAPYVGNICMDVCMIDVTDIDCREGKGRMPMELARGRGGSRGCCRETTART